MTDADNTELWSHLLRYSDLPSVFLSSYCHSKHSIHHILMILYHLLLQSAIPQLIYLERVFYSTLGTLESMYQQEKAEHDAAKGSMSTSSCQTFEIGSVAGVPQYHPLTTPAR
jgi:hypothetical protein